MLHVHVHPAWLPAWPHTSRWCNAVPPALRMWSKVTMADGKVLSKERHVAELQQACTTYAIVHDALYRGLYAHRTRDAYFILCMHVVDLP